MKRLIVLFLSICVIISGAYVATMIRSDFSLDQFALEENLTWKLSKDSIQILSPEPVPWYCW